MQFFENYFIFRDMNPREFFPSLQSDWIYFENAGGSQIPHFVYEKINHYYKNNYVQLGAGYEMSNSSDAIMKKCKEFVNFFINNTDDSGLAIMGPSTSQLIFNLADSFHNLVDTSSEIIIANFNHEANISPWTRLAKRKGCKVIWWEIEKQSFACDIDELVDLINEKTQILAIPHVSNILGDILDIELINRKVKEKNKKVKLIVDGVAYAPHRKIDVRKWGVDLYIFSWYKSYGPHLATMFVKNDLLNELQPPNHEIIDKSKKAYTFELGGINHELCASLLGVQQYFDILGKGDLDKIFSYFEEIEGELQTKLIRYLLEKPTRLIGKADTDTTSKVPTISFITDEQRDAYIIKRLHDSKIACRRGCMYSDRLIHYLGYEGVIRISMVHYNTIEELNHLTKTLDELLK